MKKLQKMELNNLIEKLVQSGMADNQTLGLTLMGSDTISDEQKLKYLKILIDDFRKDTEKFLLDENKTLFATLREFNTKLEDKIIKKRVTKI